MSARLDSLIARNLSGSTAALQARTPSLFEPAPQAQSPLRGNPIQPVDDDWGIKVEENLARESHDSRTRQPERPEKTINPGNRPLAQFSAHPDLSSQHADQPSFMDRPTPSLSPTKPSQAIMPVMPEDTPSTAVHRTVNKHAVSPAIAIQETAISTPPQKPALLTIEGRNSDRPALIGKVTPAASKSEHEHENASLLPMRVPGRKTLQPAGMMNPVGLLATPEPSIQVTIGRIEIRAEREPSGRRKPEPTSPVMGLDDYLRQKNTRLKQ